jgi:ribonuclease VapC
MFVDASAAAGIILDEPDRDSLYRKLKSTKRRFMSAIAEYETVMAVRRVKQIGVPDAQSAVLQFQKIFAIQNVPIDQRHARIALLAFDQFGKGRGHKAGLNMGDCFSYACAKIQKVPLLCKGEDFIHTDIQVA